MLVCQFHEFRFQALFTELQVVQHHAMIEAIFVDLSQFHERVLIKDQLNITI